MRSILIHVGLVLLLAGLFWPWLGKIPLGRLPGDIVIVRSGFKVYIPIATTLLLSLLPSLLFRLFRK
jgi:hypothetical protein